MAAATQDQVRRAIERSNATGTAAEVLAAITDKSIERSDSTPVTASTLETRIGKVLAVPLIEAFGAAKAASARLEAQFYQFATVGLDMSADARREGIDELVLAGVFTAEQGELLKSLGRWQESPLEVAAGSRGLTTDETTVQSVLDSLAALAKWRPFVADVENGLATGSIATWADVVALAEARA